MPTKDRPLELLTALRSVLKQTTLPSELIIVDQSDEDYARTQVQEEFRRQRREGVVPEMSYIHDPAIQGANAARNEGLSRARGNVIAFLDDDCYLETEALSVLLETYKRRSDLQGVSGVIINYQVPGLLARIVDRTFSWGPFFDERQRVYWNWKDYSQDDVVLVTKMTGCLMSFRASAVSGIQFDASPKTLRVRGEDVDFCLKIARTMKAKWIFGIAMGARVVHHPSAMGRFDRRKEELLMVSTHYLYVRHLKHSLRNLLYYVWWNVGLVLSAAGAGLWNRSLEPMQSLINGLRQIKQGYQRAAGCSFPHR
jgi:glycosyltransferase involved in cell wall biosynthesis